MKFEDHSEIADTTVGRIEYISADSNYKKIALVALDGEFDVNVGDYLHANPPIPELPYELCKWLWDRGLMSDDTVVRVKDIVDALDAHENALISQRRNDNTPPPSSNLPCWNNPAPHASVPMSPTLSSNLSYCDKKLSADDVQWIVNDNAELGVMVNGKAFFLYKGHSLTYESATHDNGTPMYYRPVFEYEFGECCHPINYLNPHRIGTVSLADSNDWERLPATIAPEQPKIVGDVEKELSGLAHRFREEAVRISDCSPAYFAIEWCAKRVDDLVYRLTEQPMQDEGKK